MPFLKILHKISKVYNVWSQFFISQYILHYCLRECKMLFAQTFARSKFFNFHFQKLQKLISYRFPNFPKKFKYIWKLVYLVHHIQAELHPSSSTFARNLKSEFVAIIVIMCHFLGIGFFELSCEIWFIEIL